MDEIVKIIEREINDQVSKKLTDFILHVSKDFKIPAKLLLRYLEEPAIESADKSCCIGLKKDGKRCSRKAKHNGYCGFHQEQSKKLYKPIEIATGSKIVHAQPRESPKSGVIDMNLIRI